MLKTFYVQVWAIKQGEIHCIQVHDMKEAVMELTANSNVACFSTQGTGVKASNLFFDKTLDFDGMLA